jgi:DNA end-binding protein Ku
MAVAARSIWKGSISFGLVNIPVKLYSATEDKSFSFNQLCENGHRIQYKKWCPVEDREVQWSEIKKGYEITKDNYVIVEKSDIDNIKMKTTKTIDIKEFIDARKLDPIFVEKSYYIAPDAKTVDKAYSLFVNVLKNTNKIAIGKVVLRDKEILVGLRAYQRGILMHQLHYLEEIKPIDEIKEIATNESSGKPKVDQREITLAETLVKNLTSDSFDISSYSDSYAEQLEGLINAKAQGKKHIIAEKSDEPRSGNDLLEALKASVRKSGSSNSNGSSNNNNKPKRG